MTTSDKRRQKRVESLLAFLDLYGVPKKIVDALACEVDEMTCDIDALRDDLEDSQDQAKELAETRRASWL